MPDKILLTGATGFVGGHLLDRLDRAGAEVVCTSRDPKRAAKTLGRDDVRALDVHDATSVARALEGIGSVVYLVHGLREGKGYADREETAAETFVREAERAGVERIVYLGGIEPEGEPSPHLASRLRTGRILRAGAAPTVELRAAMIIGGGSESWRIVRDVAARLPLMVLPKWLQSRSQPVAIADVTAALHHALTVEIPTAGGAVFDIPGPQTLSCREIIERTCRLLGSRPRSITVPVGSPRLSSYWLRMVTRADGHVIEELVQGLSSDLLSSQTPLWPTMPEHTLTSFDDAARAALADEAQTVPRWVLRVETAMRSLTP